MKKIESLYLHFPFCTHLCNYCDFYKKVPQNKTQDFESFHQYLQGAFKAHEKLMKDNGYSWGALKTLYIGGGTPSLWGLEGKIFLEKFLSDNGLVLDADCEFTLEVNPGAWEENILNEWEKLGVNRYSLGIQSLDGALSKQLDRVHSIDDVFDTLEFFSKRKANFSVDFMLGLPQSKELNRNVITELERTLKYSPSHFSVYILTVKDNYIHYKQLPTEEWIEKEYLETAEFLKKHNFGHYEVSNFALPGFASRHNLSYWNSNTVAALGPSATGFMAEEKLRYKWKTKEPAMEMESLTEDEYKLEKMYMALRANGINLPEMISINGNWKEVTSKWIAQSWAEIDSRQNLFLTSKGYLLLDSLINELFILKLL